MNKFALTVENLTKVYFNPKTKTQNTALNNLSFQVREGEIFGLLGPNGAGKTTMFSCLLDLIKPSTGKVINNGVDVMESEGWKSFTSAFLDDTFLIGYLMPEDESANRG